MDLVGAADEVVLFAEGVYFLEFFSVEYAGTGVVWVAEEEDFGVGLDGFFEGVPVENVAVAIAGHGCFDYAAPLEFGSEYERRIDGGGGEDAFLWGGEGVGGDVDADDETGEPDKPFGLDFPTVVAFEHLDDGLGG